MSGWPDPVNAPATASRPGEAPVRTARRFDRLRAGLVAFIMSGGIAAPLTSAGADLKVRSPIVEYGEIDFEHNGLVTFGDHNGGGGQSYTAALGYGLTPWWGIELEGGADALAGQNLRFTARNLENTFQLLPEGQFFWLDLGFFAEYGNAIQRDEPVPLAARVPGRAAAEEANRMFFARLKASACSLLRPDLAASSRASGRDLAGHGRVARERGLLQAMRASGLAMR
ncbi:MAG: hypothetical protein JOY71_24115 [Acetobacteraceae bacterium]|nr:hypothetical protein [Acetobacteraceae bacterium]